MSSATAKQACRELLVEIRKISKPEEPGWKAIHRAADRAKPAWKREFLAAVKATQDAVSAKAVEAALIVGNAKEAYEAIDWGAMNALESTWQTSMLDLMDQGAAVAAKDLPAITVAPPTPPGGRPTLTAVGGQPPPAAVLTFRFDITNPEAVRYAETKSAELVAELVGESGRAIKAKIQRDVTRAFNEGIPPAKLAREIKQYIGLTERQTEAVETFQVKREKLIANIYHDLTPGQVQQKAGDQTDRYRAKLLSQRAETIARTETISASSAGQQELWRQAKLEGFLGDRVQKWLITPDDRLCPTCSQMTGDRSYAEMGATFDTPLGASIGPALHPQCRCGISSVRRSQMEASL